MATETEPIRVTGLALEITDTGLTSYELAHVLEGVKLLVYLAPAEGPRGLLDLVLAELPHDGSVMNIAVNK